MNDFASTALLNLIANELRQQGFPVNRDDTFAGKCSHDTKRDLLDAALGSLGPASILAIGQGINRAPPNPVLTILLMANHPVDLYTRWQRLERYCHGRHRTKLLREDDVSLKIEHRSLRGPSPSEGEDLLVAGLIAALFERIGTQGLCLSIGDQQAIGSAGIKHDLCRSDSTGIWVFRWSGLAPKVQQKSLTNKPSTFEERIRQLFDDDPGRSWLVALAAKELGTSPRSLQRSLAAQGTSFRTLLRVARAEAASKMLLESAYPLVAVGYACGYSDQAHFSREFKSRFNLSPSDYLTMLR